MMHECEKSDPTVVAVKPVNNAERSVAESVEPRVGTEGRRHESTPREPADCRCWHVSAERTGDFRSWR
jgi:hypothetical protein